MRTMLYTSTEKDAKLGAMGSDDASLAVSDGPMGGLRRMLPILYIIYVQDAFLAFHSIMQLYAGDVLPLSVGKHPRPRSPLILQARDDNNRSEHARQVAVRRRSHMTTVQ